ncbi:MAG: CotH kinase family protein [Lachnospiraceae bacterium]|nr:CotH kinase family protein [Lachnospiraceae bacterium]
MRYKRFGIVMAVIMLAASVLCLPVESVEQRGRVHQHLTARADTGCDCDGTQLCSHLPLVLVDTRGQDIPGVPSGQFDRFGQATYTMAQDGESVIRASVSVIDNGGSNNHPGDKPAFVTDCEFRIRGKSSRYFPKLSYAMKLVDEAGNGRKLPMMGMDAHHEWVLNGPILDKSLIRNYMWYNISGEVMEYAPNVRFCELMLDGEYEGLYVMTESITDGEDCRLHLSLNVKNEKGTGYLLRLDRPEEAELSAERNIQSYNERMLNFDSDVSIRYPGKRNLTPELAKDIELDYSAFEKALFSYDYDTEDYGYQNWIDVDNFVTYYIINEFTSNMDAGKYSTYIYKEVGEKYRLCVWDFNNSCDNYQEQAVDETGFQTRQQAWFFMLFKDEKFVQKVLDRYEQLRGTYLSDEYLMEYIDETLTFLGPAVERNNERWAAEIDGWDALLPAERGLHSHEEAVMQLKAWIKARGAWLDENIHVLTQYGHPSRTKLYNH